MRRILTIFVVFALLAVSVAGCGPAGAQQSSPGQNGAETSASPAETPPSAPTSSSAAPPSSASRSVFPLTVTDQAGRSVTLEAPATRIVSGYYISSSTCIALGLKDRLVGTEEQIEARPIYQLAAPELIGAIANVGSARAFDMEACLAAEPDLVILPARAQEYAATLAEMDISAVVVNPESHEAMVEMITLIASAADVGEAAEALIGRYNEVLDKVAGLTAGLTEADKPAVYMCNPGTYMSTAPKDMYQASLIASAGGVNAGDGLDGDSWIEVSYEQILAMNPDVIIIPTNNMANGQPDYAAAELMADANLAGVAAIQNGAVYNMPAGLEAWDSPVPSGVLGMLWMLSTLHPELYTQEALIQDAADFYADFYGFEMDATVILD